MIQHNGRLHHVDTKWSEHTISEPPRRTPMPTITHTTSRLHRIGHELGVPIACLVAMVVMAALWVLGR